MWTSGPSRLLAAVRLVNGAVALLAPAIFARQLGTSSVEGAAGYPFRLFGIRALVGGAELLRPGLVHRLLPEVTVLVHASDVASAVLAGRRGEVSASFARRTTVLSGCNTALAVAALLAARRGDRLEAAQDA